MTSDSRMRVGHLAVKLWEHCYFIVTLLLWSRGLYNHQKIYRCLISGQEDQHAGWAVELFEPWRGDQLLVRTPWVAKA
jgi:hypothetical protein